MEDHDNWELDSDARREQLEEAVRDFNEENNTTWHPMVAFKMYEQWRMTDKEL
jgi:hypothetical protein